MARLVSLIVLTVLIVFLGITFFQVIAPFLLPLFLAGVVALLCQPVFRYFLLKTNHKTHWAAGLTTVAILAMLFVPLATGTVIATAELYAFAQDRLEPEQWKPAYGKFRERFDADTIIDDIFTRFSPPPDEGGDQLTEWKARRSRFHEQVEVNIRANAKAALDRIAERTMGYAASTFGIVGRIVSGIVGGLMFIIGLFYFLADGPNLLAAARELIPVNQDYQHELLHRFNTVIRAVVLATFAAALGQGIATAAALYFFVGHFFLLSILCTLTALIPLIGTWLVWAPVAIWLAADGHWASAAFLTAYGTFFIGTLDNIIRTYVLHSDAKLHPLLAFVSVLGGLQAMGLWGIFVGPTVASCLHALVKIFNTELKAFSEEKFASIKGKSHEAPKLTADASAEHAQVAAGDATSDSEQKPKRSRRRKRSRKSGGKPAANPRDKK